VLNPTVGMDNPVFKHGMIFSSVEELKRALNSNNVRNRIKVEKLKIDKRRVNAVCKPSCPWFMRGTKDNKTYGFVIRNYYEGVRTCQASWELKTLHHVCVKNF
jgi:hypothetical protein